MKNLKNHATLIGCTFGIALFTWAVSYVFIAAEGLAYSLSY